MPYLIRLKPGHPRKTMQRDGVRVGEDVPVILDVVTQGIKEEKWFVVAKISEEEAKKLALKSVSYFHDAGNQEEIEVEAEIEEKEETTEPVEEVDSKKPKGKK